MAAERRRATFEDLERWSGPYHAELLDGEIVQKALPRIEHAFAQTQLAAWLGNLFQRRASDDGRGGWWILTEAHVEMLPHTIYVPDLCGLRRERVPELPRADIVRVRPDWVCEILSPSTAKLALVDKLRMYQRCEVAHYWIVDPAAETLTIYRHQGGAYVVAQVAARGERIRPEPFGAAELDLGVVFGDEPGAAP